MYLKIFSLILLFISFSVNADSTVKDNYLCSDSSDFTGFDPAPSNWYHITEGQTLQSVSIESQGHFAGCLDVRASTASDKSNVTWVQNGMSNLGMPWLPQNMVGSFAMFSDTPNSLSLAIVGTLSLTLNYKEYACPNVYIGEGSNAMGYNWWLFFNTTVGKKGYLSCYDKSNYNQVLLSAKPSLNQTIMFGFSIYQN